MLCMCVMVFFFASMPSAWEGEHSVLEEKAKRQRDEHEFGWNIGNVFLLSFFSHPPSAALSGSYCAFIWFLSLCFFLICHLVAARTKSTFKLKYEDIEKFISTKSKTTIANHKNRTHLRQRQINTSSGTYLFRMYIIYGGKCKSTFCHPPKWM